MSSVSVSQRVCVCMYIYIYISLCVCVCVFVFGFVFMCVCSAYVKRCPHANALYKYIMCCGLSQCLLLDVASRPSKLHLCVCVCACHTPLPKANSRTLL